MLKSSRIEAVDGVKGICGIWVVVFHYLLAYASFVYIGWESGVAAADRTGCYFRYFPYSVLSNGSWPLYIFFAIIAFIPAYIFFQKDSFDNLRRQVTIRYFRLLFPTAGNRFLSSGGKAFRQTYRLDLPETDVTGTLETTIFQLTATGILRYWFFCFFAVY